MARYTWVNGQFIDKTTGQPMKLPERFTPSRPYIVSDIQPYRSPITGEVVSGRAARRDDLKKHDCVDAREISKGKILRGPKAEKYARMTGLPVKGRE